ncbi:uncharacterized protein LOC128205623 isoform X8 [Mya arenaria]|uniref:uncharacterized protein LOC128205623 isoform X8 n=1 Tax=Mya arenaria TaxID=6604 RepID=UPI0022E70A34|nr:uncharacterized protein LOC128205623 isoform X8 [Mya arenaria]
MRTSSAFWKDGMMKMTGGTTLIAFTTLLLTLTSDASPIDKDNGDAAGTSGAAIGGVVGGGVSLLAIALAIGMFIRMWRRRRKDSNGGIEGDARADEEARTYEPLQKRTEQPIYQNANDNGTDNYAVLFADTNF